MRIINKLIITFLMMNLISEVQAGILYSELQFGGYYLADNGTSGSGMVSLSPGIEVGYNFRSSYEKISLGVGGLYKHLNYSSNSLSLSSEADLSIFLFKIYGASIGNFHLEGAVGTGSLYFVESDKSDVVTPIIVTFLYNSGGISYSLNYMRIDTIDEMGNDVDDDKFSIVGTSLGIRLNF